jgi:peptide/nickel transport system permease protein
VPGDPAASWAGPHASRDELAQVRENLGLDLSLPQQIWRYFTGVARGDWGTSIHTHQPVLRDILDRVPSSIELVVAAMVVGLGIGIPLGLVSARWAHDLPDGVVRILAVLAVSMPAFWLALILQIVFFERLHWLPVAGQYDPNLDYTHPLVQYTRMPVIDALITGNWWVFRSALAHLVLPALVIAAYPFGVVARMVRGSELDTLGEDHVKAVRALGFPERTVFGRFALKPAMVPVVSVVALVFAYSLVNTFLVEAIFDWPGLGSYAAGSITSLDTPAITGITLFVAVVYVIANLVVDVVQAWIDPRIRLA